MSVTTSQILASDEVENEEEIASRDQQHWETVKKRSVKGALSYGIRTFLLQGIALAANLALAAFLSPSEFGVYFLVSAAVSFFTFLSDIGLAASLIQKEAEPTTSELRTTFTVQTGLSFAIMIIILALTPLWRQWYGFGGTELALLYALGGSFFLATLKTISSVLLERELHFDKLVIPAIVENIVFYGVAVFFAWQGWGVSAYTWAVLARGMSGAAIMWLLRPWALGLAWDSRALKNLLKVGLKFQLNDLLARIKDDLFIVVLGSWLPAAQLGLVSWSKRWSLFPFQLTVQPVMAITFPTYARLQNDKDRLGKAIDTSLFFISLITFPLLTGLALFAKPLLELLPVYHKWLPALPLLYFFLINIGWSALSTPLTNTLNAIGEITSTLRLMILWTILTWLLTPLFVWWLGALGVAVASAVISCTSLLTFYLVRKHVPIHLIRSVGPSIIATLVLALVGILTRISLPTTWANIAIGISLASLSWIFAWLAMNQRLRSELNLLGIKI